MLVSSALITALQREAAMTLRFHWRLPQGGERAGVSRGHQAALAQTGLPDIEPQAEFCRAAEESGIDSLLTDFGWSKPDSILLGAALGMMTSRIKFIIAYRSGLICPTSFVQQLNTLSALIGGRFSLNVVAGHSPEEQRYYGDFLPHDERYSRTEEFLEVCRRFWVGEGPVSFEGLYFRVEGGRLNTPFVSEERRFPELYIAGSSEAARKLALSQGTCWMRLAEPPSKVAESACDLIAAGKELGIRCSVVARPTREEAIEAAREIQSGADSKFNDRAGERGFVNHSDSISINSSYRLAETEWLTPTLWTGLIRSHGGAAIALVGSYDEIAESLIEYGKAGVTQFILSGWPKLDEMRLFGRGVIPRVRRLERKSHAAVVAEPAPALAK
ncbi:MAG TPA: LLM class flavin-dependent oxidoreductase [Blastocatellia bacterium]|nr:LLM class flavin-dependent oxidoreductase [Blastocatellia bacterium]